MPIESNQPIHRRGRGSALNPANKFEGIEIEEDPAALEEDERRSVPTRFLKDTSRSVLSKNNSPDVPFTYSVNPYRGCEHGCVYCYARPSHEFLGFSAGLDFETKILVKHEAPDLLAKQFEHPKWKPQIVALSGNTDPYQPGERSLTLTRRCLEVFRRYRNPVGIITKNHLVTRDIDILADLARLNLVHVNLSITTLRDDICREMEPRTSRPARRLDAIRQLSEAGISTGVMVAPVIPGLTDEELPAILKAARAAGARRASWIPVRLPGAVEPIFDEWLGRVHPGRADKIRARIRSMRGGEMNDARFGWRMRGEGVWADVIGRMFKMHVRNLGFDTEHTALSTGHFRRAQPELF